MTDAEPTATANHPTFKPAREALQASLDATNAENPPTYDPPALLGNFRHKCPAARNVSKPIDLKEIRTEATDVGFDVDLAMLHREGTCQKCKQVARSKTGRFVISSERPPISGRVAR